MGRNGAGPVAPGAHEIGVLRRTGRGIGDASGTGIDMPESRCSPPHDVHFGQARRVLEQRECTLRLAWSRHPERFVNGTPKPQALPQGLNQPAGRDYDATACSVNPNRCCLNVVDRFRGTETVWT